MAIRLHYHIQQTAERSREGQQKASDGRERAVGDQTGAS